MKTHLNLLPWRFRFRLLLHTRLVGWSAVWAISVLVAAGACYGKYLQLQAGKGALARQTRLAAPLRELQKLNQKMRDRRAEVDGQGRLLADLEGTAPPLSLLGLISRSARVSSGWLQVQTLNLSQIQMPADGKPERKQDGAKPITKRQLTLKGTASSDLAVTQFVVALRDSAGFDNVELKSSLGAQTARGKARQYLVECLY